MDRYFQACDWIEFFGVCTHCFENQNDHGLMFNVGEHHITLSAGEVFMCPPEYAHIIKKRGTKLTQLSNDPIMEMIEYEKEIQEFDHLIFEMDFQYGIQ